MHKNSKPHTTKSQCGDNKRKKIKGRQLKKQNEYKMAISYINKTSRDNKFIKELKEHYNGKSFSLVCDGDIFVEVSKYFSAGDVFILMQTNKTLRHLITDPIAIKQVVKLYKESNENYRTKNSLISRYLLSMTCDIPKKCKTKQLMRYSDGPSEHETKVLDRAIIIFKKIRSPVENNLHELMWKGFVNNTNRKGYYQSLVNYLNSTYYIYEYGTQAVFY